MPRHRRRQIIWGLGLAVSIAACAPPAQPSAAPLIPLLHVDNQTTIPVTVVVNGSALAVVPPKTIADPVKASFPDRPWTVELRLASGRSLATLEIPGGDVTVGYFARGLTQCGVIDLAIADPLPGGEPAFIADPSAAPCR